MTLYFMSGFEPESFDQSNMLTSTPHMQKWRMQNCCCKCHINNRFFKTGFVIRDLNPFTQIFAEFLFIHFILLCESQKADHWIRTNNIAITSGKNDCC